MKRLVTIPFSHYCEKARWALDRAQMRYVEEKHLPGLHFPAKWLRRGSTLPILVTPHGTLRHSHAILEWVDRVATPLYPREDAARADVAALERAFDDGLGPAARVVVYHHMLRDLEALEQLVAPSLTLTQRLSFRVVMRAVGPRIRRLYRVEPANVAAAERTIRDAFARADERLRARPFLGGDAFGAADITFASLAAPVLAPTGHPAQSDRRDAMPPALRSLVEELRATRAGEHALRAYREERHARGPSIG